MCMDCATLRGPSGYTFQDNDAPPCSTTSRDARRRIRSMVCVEPLTRGVLRYSAFVGASSRPQETPADMSSGSGGWIPCQSDPVPWVSGDAVHQVVEDLAGDLHRSLLDEAVLDLLLVLALAPR